MSIPKRESELQAACLFEMRRQVSKRYEVVTIQDVRKSGWPDVALNGFGKTTWWEFKHATPSFSSPGIQEHICRRLAKTSYCRYIVYYETRSDVCTYIVHPDHVAGHDGKLLAMVPEVVFDGHDHFSVVQFMRNIHELHL